MFHMPTHSGTLSCNYCSCIKGTAAALESRIRSRKIIRCPRESAPNSCITITPPSVPQASSAASHIPSFHLKSSCCTLGHCPLASFLFNPGTLLPCSTPNRVEQTPSIEFQTLLSPINKIYSKGSRASHQTITFFKLPSN